jgi:hypothetical protein
MPARGSSKNSNLFIFHSTVDLNIFGYAISWSAFKNFTSNRTEYCNKLYVNQHL